MNKWINYIFLGFFAVQGLSQDPIDQAWKEKSNEASYQKSKQYKGPENWSHAGPTSLKDQQDYPSATNQNTPLGTTPSLSIDDIEKDREKRFGQLEKNGNGPKTKKPELMTPEPIEFPDFDAPDIDAPDVDLPDVDPPSFLFSKDLWRFIIILLIIAAVVILAYILIKNYQPKDKKTVVDVSEDWNPEVVTKSELELQLEQAIQSGNYREGIRIYYLFILKELNEKRWIRWQPEKTNYDYVLEMRSKKDGVIFEEVVRIYDLVWYGEYQINEAIYKQLHVVMHGYYQQIQLQS